MIKKFAFSIPTLFLLPIMSYAEGIEVGFGTLWDSQYVSEGRDNLEKGGMLSSDVFVSYDFLTAGFWAGFGDSTDYEERNYFVEASGETGPLEVTVGYTYLEFPREDESDNEISLGLSYPEISIFSLGIDYVYSTEAEGGFLELSVVAPIPMENEQLTLEPYLLQAFDFGYASETHDGPNHFQIGIDVAYTLSEHVEILGYIAHSFAQQDVENDGLSNETWGGFGFAASF